MMVSAHKEENTKALIYCSFVHIFSVNIDFSAQMTSYTKHNGLLWCQILLQNLAQVMASCLMDQNTKLSFQEN